jgi:MFS family permease
MPSTISRMVSMLVEFVRDGNPAAVDRRAASTEKSPSVPESPPLYTRTFWLACAVHLTGVMSFGMFLLFPLFIRTLGGDELTIGLVLGLGLGVSVVLRPSIGTLLDRFGRRRVLLWSGLANVVSLLPFPLLTSTGVGLFALATFHLLVGGALFAAYFTYASDIVPVARRIEGIAIFGTFGIAPNGIGPALAEVVIARAGYPAFFVVAAAFAALSLALTALLPDDRPSRAHASTATSGAGGGMIRAALEGGLVRLMLATALFGVGVNVAFFFVAPFARDLGIARAAPFFAAYASTTILLRVLGRRLLGRIGSHRIAVPGFAVFALGLVTLCLLPASGVLVLAGIACGAGHGSLFPVLNTLIVARTPPRLHGTVLGLYTGALDLGAVLGAPLGGAVARAAGYRVMFALTALACLAGLASVADDARHARH